MVLVDQHPSLISVPALGNTYTTVAMNLKHRSDVNAVGGAMLLEEEGKHFLGQLPVGWAMVKLQGRWTEPFVVRVPHLKLPKGAMTDQRLTQLSGGWPINAAGTSGPSEEGKPLRGNGASLPDQPPSTSRREEALLDVAQHPLSGVVERTGMQFHEMAGTAFEQPCLATRKLVQSGILGTVVQVFAQKSYPYRDDRPQDEEADDGLLMHVGVHAPDSVHVATTLSSCPSSDTMFPERQAVQAETANTAPTARLLGEDSCPSRPPCLWLLLGTVVSATIQ